MTEAKMLPTPYQQFIHLSRYARWNEELGRRETWEETVERYVDFFDELTERQHTGELKGRVKEAILDLKVMPSMRAMMTAGEALKREGISQYNCSALSVNTTKAFSEALYVLMCFHPDTLVDVRGGHKRIADIAVGDEVLSFNEESQEFEYRKVTASGKTPSSAKKKVLVSLSNGQTIKCTEDHQWLTSNKGWVEAKDLTEDDDLVYPKFEVYKAPSVHSGKSYIGYTGKSVDARWKQHVASALNENSRDYDTHLHNAIRKYGAEDWARSVVDVAWTEKEAQEKEISQIASLDTLKQGYNMTAGGEGTSGFTWSDDQRKAASENAYPRTEYHRKRQSQVMRSNLEKIAATRRTQDYRDKARVANTGPGNPMYGKSITEERKAELSIANSGAGNPFYGRSHSEEVKQALREAAVERLAKFGNPFKGKKHTDETKMKMKEHWRKRREESQRREDGV